MNIQKMKEFLVIAKKYMPSIVGNEYIDEALAELENPAEDYDISEAASDIFSNADGWFINYNKIKQIIQKCAESYHAKKCSECQKAKDSL